jgi:glycosyltransferase involved in cell wall biosynthesis
VRPEDPEALRDAILTLYNDPERAEVLGQNGRRFVRHHFCRDELADRYLQVLDRLVAVNI